MQRIDVRAIKQELFLNPAVRAKIIADYGIETQPSDPDELGTILIQKFGQVPLPQPLEQSISNQEVFRAAVWAIGSNSRAWATFLKLEPQLRELLHGYDPVRTALSFGHSDAQFERVKAYLPGITSSKDTHAIQKWAQLLSDRENYYGYIQHYAHTFQELHQERYNRPLTSPELLMCLVGYLSWPPSHWAGSRFLPKHMRHLGFEHVKLAGMGYSLASEFFRNLRWNGFKPDRHIRRLFDRWFPDRATVQKDVQRLQSLVGQNFRELNDYLAYSLIGVVASPTDLPLSNVDNFVWLLAVYIEKKGKESSRSYLAEEVM